MGANYAEAAIEQWASQLDGKPLVALIRMALVVPDAKKEPTYWGGWETLAHALGANMAWDSDSSDEAERLRRNAQRAVERVVKRLVEVGAIQRVGRGHAGRQAEYLLNLRPVDKRRYATD